MKMLFGFLILAAGIYLYLLAGKNEFNRTNEYGVQEYKDFNDKISSQAGNSVLRFIGFFLFMVGGVMMFIAKVSGE